MTAQAKGSGLQGRRDEVLVGPRRRTMLQLTRPAIALLGVRSSPARSRQVSLVARWFELHAYIYYKQQRRKQCQRST